MAVIVREKAKGSGEWWLFINPQGKCRSKKIGDKRTSDAVAGKAEKVTPIGTGSMGVTKLKAYQGESTLLTPGIHSSKPDAKNKTPTGPASQNQWGRQIEQVRHVQPTDVLPNGQLTT